MTEFIQGFFAIRHNPTGGYLPTLPRGRRNGYSFSEPEKPDETNTPRLHHTLTEARIVLTVWLQGQQFYSYDGDGCTSFDKLVPIPSRKREEMEIVRINLVLAPFHG